MAHVENLLDTWILDIHFIKFLYCAFHSQMPLLLLSRTLGLVLLSSEVIGNEEMVQIALFVLENG